MRHRLNSFLVGLFSLVALFGCTDPGETTGMAAATGGAIGAGLGAIVGSQTGDAGAGLVLGGVAGAGTGAAIGNALEAQEESIRTQDEAIERQERRILAQRSELEELRKASDDQIVFNEQALRSPGGSINAPTGERSFALNQPRSADIAPVAPRAASPSIQEKTLAAQPPRQREVVRGSFGWEQYSDQNSTDTSARKPAAVQPLSGDCQQAQAEINKASAASENADRLFHYRRALRLCPENAEFHNGLGELYLTLDRVDDARFEFREALRLEPNNTLARRNLTRLN